MNEREVLTVCHVCSMVPPHSCCLLSYYVVRFHFGPNSVSNSVIVMLYASTSFILVLMREGYTRNVNIMRILLLPTPFRQNVHRGSYHC